MNLPPGATFYAYEIHQQRVDFLNAYFKLAGLQGAALVQDILVEPPRESGDVALLLKEIHRMEKRRKGIVLPLLDALDVHFLAHAEPHRAARGQRDLSPAGARHPGRARVAHHRDRVRK